MNYQEAKMFHSENKDVDVYMARYDGSVWQAGRMVEVGEVIGYFTSEKEAIKACRDYELFDFDKDHLYTSVEKCDNSEFGD